MKVTLQSTTQIVQVGNKGSIDCRVWEGMTEGGIKVQALIPRIAARKGEDLSQFEAELKEQCAPSMDFQSFPLRMII